MVNDHRTTKFGQQNVPPSAYFVFCFKNITEIFSSFHNQVKASTAEVRTQQNAIDLKRELLTFKMWLAEDASQACTFLLQFLLDKIRAYGIKISLPEIEKNGE